MLAVFTTVSFSLNGPLSSGHSFATQQDSVCVCVSVSLIRQAVWVQPWSMSVVFYTELLKPTPDDGCTQRHPSKHTQDVLAKHPPVKKALEFNWISPAEAGKPAQRFIILVSSSASKTRRWIRLRLASHWRPPLILGYAELKRTF